MQLLTIRAAGFTATVDACAQDDGQVWLRFSLAAHRAAREGRPVALAELG